MFRVVIKEYSDKGDGNSHDFVTKTEKFYELIGRYTFKIAPPDLIFSEDGIMEFEFFKQIDNSKFIAASVTFCKISSANDKKDINKVVSINKVQNSPLPPPPPPMSTEPDDKRLIALEASGAFKLSKY